MNLSLPEAEGLLRALLAGLPPPGSGPEVLVAPPFTAIETAGRILRGSPVRLAAQNMHWEASGAFTGEVSPAQICDAGCSGVILGHSERRRYFGETDAVVHRKLKAALAHKLMPIVCIGETLEERESNRTFRVLEIQVQEALRGFAPTELSVLVLAYEPVWAIGTGKTATPQQAQEAHRFIRQQVERLYGASLAQSIRILYGGSVTPDNIDSLMAQNELDGALVGGASLKPVSFLRIVHYKTPLRSGV